MVGLTRLELVTSRLSGVRSNHLSYRPARKVLRYNTTGFLIYARTILKNFSIPANNPAYLGKRKNEGSKALVSLFNQAAEFPA